MTRHGLTGGAIIAMMLSVSAWAGATPSGHGHDESFSAGEPGDPTKPTRIVQVTMGEGDSKMSFVPAKVDVKTGEQIKFVLRNNGELEHEFVLASAADNLKHADAMTKNPDMKQDDPNARMVAPKGTGEIVWKFSKSGEFEFACLIPGHRASGMVGTVTVK